MITLSSEMAELMPPIMALIAGAFLSGLALYTRWQSRARRKDHPAE